MTRHHRRAARPFKRGATTTPAVEPRTERPAGGSPGVVAYFGPDASDPAVHRRIAQWARAGFRVLPFVFERSGAKHDSDVEFVSLGMLMPQSLIARIGPIARALLRLLPHRRRLAGAQLFIGRNLDNAVIALLMRCICGSSAPLVYEILDVNRVCTDPGLRGVLVRCIERWLLSRIDHLIVSSPHFATTYFQEMLGYRGGWSLFENKVPRFVHERLVLTPAKEAPGGGAPPWRIGWFGYLDDERSWDILRHVAQSLPHDVVIHVRGIPYAGFNMDRFLADVAQFDNIVYGGPYRNPEDLAEVYNSVDLIWSTDCNVPAANSKWLLTNGLYEAGYFGKPVLTSSNTAVGKFVAKHATGWCLHESLAESLMDFIRNLSPQAYAAKCRDILAIRSRLFIESDEVQRIWAEIHAPSLPRRASRRATAPQPNRSGRAEAGTKTAKLLCLGFFPPPIDGQRLVTQAMFERLSKLALVEPHNLDALHAVGALSKPLSAFAACIAILRARVKGFTALYLAPHSGSGLLLSCAVALLARSLRYSLTVHYHSYWNIGRRARLMAAFVAICGPKALHIVLAPPMAQDLRRLYPGARNVAAVSNCALILPHPESPRHFGGRRLRLGHLSNLTREKGIAHVFMCMRALAACGVDAELQLAGPAENEDTAALIAAAQTEFGERLHYVGRLEGEEVRRFYQEIDVFLFPTLYRHEAEPLVVIDAIASGVPVLATDRGCISYLLGTMAGRVFSADDYVEKAAAQLVAWAQNPDQLAKASWKARRRFFEVHRESQASVGRLTPTILGKAPALAQSEGAMTIAPRRTG